MKENVSNIASDIIKQVDGGEDNTNLGLTFGPKKKRKRRWNI